MMQNTVHPAMVQKTVTIGLEELRISQLEDEIRIHMKHPKCQ